MSENHVRSQDKVFGIAETRQSLLRIILVMTNVAVVLLILELLVDFNSTSPSMLLPLLLGFLVIYVLCRLNVIGLVASKVIFLVLLFISLEAHFLSNLTSYHAMAYWMLLVPLSALILVGDRGSMITLVLVIVANSVNAYIGSTQMGTSYAHDVSYQRLLFGSSILVLSAYSFAFIFYYLLQKSYQKMALQKAMISDLNNQLQTVIDALKSDLEHQSSEVQHVKGRLSQIAFHNSHIVRSPLTRIMAAAGLLGGAHDKMLIETIKESSQELDQVIKEIATLSKKEEA